MYIYEDVGSVPRTAPVLERKYRLMAFPTSAGVNTNMPMPTGTRQRRGPRGADPNQALMNGSIDKNKLKEN